MKTVLAHPSFRDVTREVDDPAPWIAQGWLPVTVTRGSTVRTLPKRKPRKPRKK